MQRWFGRASCLLDFHKPPRLERDGRVYWAGPCERCGMMIVTHQEKPKPKPVPKSARR